MKKSQVNTRNRKAPEAPESTEEHLDTRITTVATTTKETVKRNWKVLVGVVVAVLLVIGAVQIVSAIARGRKEALRDRLYSLTAGAPIAEDTPPPIAELESVVADAAGGDLDAYISRGAATYLLERATRYEANASQAKRAIESGTTTDETPEDPAALEKLAQDSRAAAGRIAAAAATRLAGDPDAVAWAKSVAESVASKSDTSWLPKPRSYDVQPPGEVPANPPSE